MFPYLDSADLKALELTRQEKSELKEMRESLIPGSRKMPKQIKKLFKQAAERSACNKRLEDLNRSNADRNRQKRMNKRRK